MREDPGFKNPGLRYGVPLGHEVKSIGEGWSGRQRTCDAMGRAGCIELWKDRRFTLVKILFL